MKTPQVFKKLAFENLHMKFSNGTELFNGASFDLPLNKVVWIHGAPGTGKSVLMKLLAGLLLPTAGRYLINEQLVNQMTFEEFLPYRKNIGYSFDFGGLIHNRTLRQNLLLPLEYHHSPSHENNRARVDQYLELFRLSGSADERPSAVNGGQRKAVCVARALVTQPELLLLDDPTTGLRGELKTNFQKHLLNGYENKNFKHIYIATEDREFMNAFPCVEIDLSDWGKARLQEAV